ncbi:MAG: hypothetical protein LBN20_01360 [Endomicrobium sp.]|jgi:hypothetical protein|nr:hypothetical protein [Endomicrobium sp.]
MKEKDTSQLIQLLMEDTGCEQDEAEIALSLSDNNIKKAVEKITVFLKVISVFKIKIIFPQESIYGLIHIVINKKLFQILRFNIVFSHNPAIYEISSQMNWVSFEKAVFSARLSEGVMEDYTKSIEEPFKQYLNEELQSAKFPSDDLIQNFFAPSLVKTEMMKEELNLSQFKKLSADSGQNSGMYSSAHKNFGVLRLEAQICKDEENGVSAKKLSAGDAVLSLITDKRDIAHYLIHLIGSSGLNPIPAQIKDISEKNDEIEIHLQYTPSVIGYTKVHKDEKLKIVSKKHSPLWKKLIPWI